MASVGEDRVRVKFNPSESNLVSDFKQETAKLINACQHSIDAPSEQRRLWHLAMTAYEEAAMWAVKAATYEE